jgi:hypothetical protein
VLAGPKAGADLAKGSWVAAVFGRGRALGAWPAEGFGDEQIDEASLFLLGACSCEVKRLNPGWDLLLNVDWDERLQLAEKARIAVLTSAGRAEIPRPPAPEPETVKFAPPEATAERASAEPARRGGLPWLAAGFGVLALAILLAKLRPSR